MAKKKTAKKGGTFNRSDYGHVCKRKRVSKPRKPNKGRVK